MARDDRYIGQTYGPAGMGMNAYMDRPGPQRRPNVRDLGQTYGPAGMGMNAYMNRPEQQQQGIPPSRRFNQGIPSPGRRKFENYLKRGLGQQGIGSLGPNIGRDRHPMARGMEQAAVDPSDWRTILRILEAGGDPQTETAGIMGAMPQERQMAELTDKQKNFMRNRYFSPDLPGAPTQDELYNRVKDREKKGLFGIGAQEPTTREEFDDYYNNLMDNFYVT